MVPTMNYTGPSDRSAIRALSVRPGAVWRQWIADCPSVSSESPLCQPSNLRGHRRHEVGDLPQGGEDVVGSNRRCAVRYDHREYRTPTLLRWCYRNLGHSDSISGVEPAKA